MGRKAAYMDISPEVGAAGPQVAGSGGTAGPRGAAGSRVAGGRGRSRVAAARVAGGALVALGGDEVVVPGERGLGGAVLGGEVDVDEAEALVEALRPLEVVHQRPDEVAAHVHAGLHRLVHRPDVAVQVADPLLVAACPCGIDP